MGDAAALGARGSQTHGSALIDQVYSGKRAVSARVRYDVQNGDHYPVIAQYLVTTTPVPRRRDPRRTTPRAQHPCHNRHTPAVATAGACRMTRGPWSSADPDRPPQTLR